MIRDVLFKVLAVRGLNLGDDIQGLAVADLLPRFDGYVDRERLDLVKDPTVVVFNGWFKQEQKAWPPSPNVIPLFFGFHIQPQSRQLMLSPQAIDYYRQWQPIGCRDQVTASLLAAHGIHAYCSRCLTLTFHRRQKEPEEGRVILVDAGPNAPIEFSWTRDMIPRRIHEGALVMSHYATSPDIEDKTLAAAHILTTYRNVARLVITTRLHCALPCVAMGIPTVLLWPNPNDYRREAIDSIIPVWLPSECHNIDWNPPARCDAAVAISLRTAFRERLLNLMARIGYGGMSIPY